MSSAIPVDLPGLEDALVPGPVFFRMTLPGDPVAWSRSGQRIIVPKFGRPFVQHYTEAKHASYMEAIGVVARAKMRSKLPTLAALTCLIIADVRIPVSWPKKDQAAALAGRLLPTSKPDDDNYAKLPRDALSKIVYVDDAQIVDGRQIKRYSASPALTIEIREFVAPQA